MNTLKKIINPLIINLGKRKESKHFPEAPVIIGACPRSGTTILLSILDAHPKIFGIPNQTYAFDRWREIKDKDSEQITDYPYRLDRLYRELLIRKIPPTAHRWLEKTPKHIRSFSRILNYFDNRVKLINIVRDGRDVVTSKHPKHNPDQYWVSVKRWVSDVSIGLSFKDHPSVISIRYEDLIAGFESTMLRIYTFLGEEPPENLTDWIKQTNIRKSIHLGKPVRNLYTDSIARWQKPEHKKRLDEFMANERAMELLKEFNYI